MAIKYCLLRLVGVTYWRTLWNCSKPSSSAAKAAMDIKMHIEDLKVLESKTNKIKIPKSY